MGTDGQPPGAPDGKTEVDPALRDAPGAASDLRLARARLAHMRHELRTPINAIIGYSELLLEEAGDRDLADFVPDLDRIREAGRTLLAQVDEVLSADKVERQADFDASAFSARLQHALRTPLSAVDGYSEMLIEEAGDRFDVVEDLERIRQGGRLLLELMDDIEWMADATEDSQDIDLRGIDGAEVLNVILAIPPVAEDDAALRTEGGRVLVVDDNATNRDLLSRRLARDGHTVSQAADGAEALGALQEADFDLVLLDIVMPRVHGFEVLRQMKGDARLAEVPVIMLSSLDDLDSVVRCIQMGADDFLPKPYEPVLLRARIGASLEKKRMRDRARSYLEVIRVEREKSDRLLLNILPPAIAARLKTGERTIADCLSDCTVLFTDLVGFTELSASLGPERLVGLLNEVFSAFDRIAFAHGLEKIKTIGDAYMAVSGLPTPRADHAVAGADAALKMVGELPGLAARLGVPLRIRVGMNSGPVVAGVIGEDKFSYDLWGDTVNTAARMESHGIPGEIHVTANTRALLADAFVLESRGGIQVKGKGLMETWLLKGRRPS